MSEIKFKKDVITIEGAKILFKNFSGRESTFNSEGSRNFCVIIDDAGAAQKLIDKGWNIHILKARDEYEEPAYYMQIAVNYNNYIMPSVYMITNNHNTALDSDTINILDNADIDNADLIIRPYNWEVGGRTGIKAYLKTGYFNIAEDDFAAKYAEEEYSEEVPFL